MTAAAALEATLVALVLAAVLGAGLVMRPTGRRARAQLRAARATAERRQRRLEALAQVSVSLSQQLDPDRLLQQITDALTGLTGAQNVVLWELDRTSDLLVRRAWTANASIGEIDLPSSLGFDVGGTGWVARHREPLFVEDIAADDRIIGTQWALSHDLVAFAGVPVVAGDDLLGVLTLNLRRGGLPEGGDRALLPSFAAQAAVAMRNARLFADNARLYEEARQRLRELEETQAQLVQAGKLSAVGQLVSGVAYELNNPSEVIRRILSLRETQLELSKISVVTEFGDEVPRVEGDSHQLQQVFPNLIINAEQAILGSGVGGRRTGDCIHVTTAARCEGAATWVVAQVTDNGPGIAPEVLPRIFEPFFTTKRVGDGTGLGPSVSHGIAEQHGGRLSVESGPGRTVFTLELPAAVARAADPHPGQPATAGGRGALVVEDEPAIVTLVTSVLDGQGW